MKYQLDLARKDQNGVVYNFGGHVFHHMTHCIQTYCNDQPEAGYGAYIKFDTTFILNIILCSGDIFVATIILPTMMESIMKRRGELNLLHIDGTSGLTNSPKMSILWMLVNDEDEKGELVGQIICSKKTKLCYKKGFELWKMLIEGSEDDNLFNNEREGTFIMNPPNHSQLTVNATMTDKEVGLIGAAQETLEPDIQLLCRFHTIQTLTKKVCLISLSIN